MRFAVKFAGIALALSLGLVVALPASTKAPAQTSQTAGPFRPNQLIEPAQLVKQMAEPKGVRPVILHVGFRVLYVGGHIPGAIYAGPASRPAGLEKLRQVAARIPRNRQVVIYCGCCPMKVCPNIHPAYSALEKMGFRRLLVLDLPNDFAKDWVQKGLPMVKGSAPR